MIIRLILILTVLALVLGGVGAAFVQAQTPDPAPATTPDSGQAPVPAQAPDPANTPAAAEKHVTTDARHDDVQSDLDAVEVKTSGGNNDDGDDDVSVASEPSVPTAPSVPSQPSVPSAPSVASTPSVPSETSSGS